MSELESKKILKVVNLKFLRCRSVLIHHVSIISNILEAYYKNDETRNIEQINKYIFIDCNHASSSEARQTSLKAIYWHLTENVFAYEMFARRQLKKIYGI